jgi:hypothetical protein
MIIALKFLFLFTNCIKICQKKKLTKLVFLFFFWSRFMFHVRDIIVYIGSKYISLQSGRRQKQQEMDFFILVNECFQFVS